MKIELQTGGRSSGKTLLTIKQNYNFNESITEEDLKNTNPFIQHLATEYVKELNQHVLKNTIAYKYIEKNKHQKKVIDRLSRKIQQQKQKIKVLIANNDINQSRIRFFMYRENKLQLIEQMFKSGTVDLAELNKIVMEEVNK